MRHANISIFIPHVGCPHTCSFCNQRAISGVRDIVGGDGVISTVSGALKNNPQLRGENTQIAFFGGSFTAIDKGYMLELLQAAHPFVKSGRVGGIRISTRPDYIDKETLQLLKQHGVTAIELGAQSMNDEVLFANGRGHTRQDVIAAATLIRETGFSLGLQMMLGLHKAGEEDDRETARQFLQLRPDTVRIYPTLVLEDTELAALYRSGQYQPMALERAVAIAKELFCLFEENNIKVIKLGLHPDSDMQASLLAGPFHPAFRQLVEGEIYFDEMRALLQQKPKGEYKVLVHSGQLSNAIGNKRANIKKLQELGYTVKIVESGGALNTLCALSD